MKAKFMQTTRGDLYNWTGPREWGIRFDFVGIEFIFSLAIKVKTPAIRIVLLGCSVWLGKIPSRSVTKWSDAAINDVSSSLSDWLSKSYVNDLDKQVLADLNPTAQERSDD